MARKQLDEIALGCPNVRDGEVTKYRLLAQDDGEIVGHITRSVQRTQDNGKEVYRVFSRTESVTGAVLEDSAVMEIANTLKPLSSQWITRNKNGNILMDARINHEDDTVQLPLNSGTPAAITFNFRGGPFLPKEKIAFYTMVLGGQSFKFYMETSREKVKVPAGNFDCYKLKLTGDADSMISQMPGKKMPPGMGMFAQHIIPTMYRWVTQDEPHYMVKFEGYYGPPFPVSDTVIEELISIEQ